MTKDEALKLALEALEKLRAPLRVNTALDAYDVSRAITAIKQALAAPVQEPVVCKHEWFSTGAMEPGECRCIKCGIWNTTSPAAPVQDIQRLSALVRAQQITIDKLEAQRQWVGLADKQKCELVEMTDSDPQPHHLRELIDVTEAKLKEKNT